MDRIVRFISCLVVVDAFFFSSNYSFIGGLNTKQILAVFGALAILVDMLRNHTVTFPKEFVTIFILSVVVSMMAKFSVAYHTTQETAYTTYFMSMFIWFTAAFAVIRFLNRSYGYVSISLLGRYIVLCTLVQGFLMLIADQNPAWNDFYLRTVPSLRWVNKVHRLYGYSDTCSLDTGGIRFAMACVLCVHLIREDMKCNVMRRIPFYIVAFGIITVTGNMIARTTLVGTLVGLGYLFVSIVSVRNSSSVKVPLLLMLEFGILFAICASRYRNDDAFHEHMRFAFEGFFALFEDGSWHTASNDKLLSMYVLPDNMETWLIGDGYFSNPAYDMNYLGDITEGYYMGTDVGYLRFIFFFGLIGLLLFSIFIIYCGARCMHIFPDSRFLFFIFTLFNFIIWAKVATDCFFILILFLCLAYVDDCNMYALEEQDAEETDEMAVT